MKRREMPEYRSWCLMRCRCNNKNDKRFKDYGGRGIKVCKRWDDFSLFLKDMGYRPSGTHSLDRIDVDGDYCPSNCRWATLIDQARNKRRTIFIESNGARKTLREWASELCIPYLTAYYRFRAGHSAEEIIANKDLRLTRNLRNKVRPKKYDHSLAMRLRCDGVSVAEIARKLNVTIGSIYQVTRKSQ